MVALPTTLQSIECSKKMQLNLLKFTISVVSALVNSSTSQRSTVRCLSKCQSDTDDIIQSVKRKSLVPEFVENVRYDNIAHWPEYCESKSNCRYCKSGTGRVYCKKCSLCLCLINARNCFLHIIPNS